MAEPFDLSSAPRSIISYLSGYPRGRKCNVRTCVYYYYYYYYYYYFYYYLLQLRFHSVAVVLILVTNNNKYT
jgi:hypothetical protein